MPVPGTDWKSVKAVSLDAAATALGVSKRTIQRLIAAGEFPKPIKVGAVSRVLVEDLDRYIESKRREDHR
jgi:excisionase family DNA binding protein